MTLAVRIAPEAEAELGAAALWYEAKRAGLGVEFIAAIDDMLEQVACDPALFPRWREDMPFRRAVVRRFPFVIFFTADLTRVHVYAVAHAKRRPGYWVGR